MPSDSTLDLIVDLFDCLFRSGGFAYVDLMLEGLDADKHSSDMLITILTVTAVAKSKLPARGKFLTDVENVLRTRNEWKSDLLMGLY